MDTTASPLVSVIIPTYNRAQSIAAAVESVQAQTYSKWELLVVDDGSSDDTASVISALASEDGRIQFIPLPANRGQSAARNEGARRASGQYLAFLDSDDRWLPEKLTKQVEVFSRASEKVAIVYTGSHFVSEDGSRSREKHARESGSLFDKELAYNPIGTPSRVMIRKDCFWECGGFDETFRSHEDWDLWIRVTEKYDVEALDEPLMEYVESSDSMSLNPAKLIDGYETLWKKHRLLERSRSLTAIHYLRLGHRLYYYAAKKEGREYLSKAFRSAPWNLKNILIPLLSLLPVFWYRSVTFILMKTAG